MHLLLAAFFIKVALFLLGVGLSTIGNLAPPGFLPKRVTDRALKFTTLISFIMLITAVIVCFWIGILALVN